MNRVIFMALFFSLAFTAIAKDLPKAEAIPGEIIIKVKDGEVKNFWNDKSLKGISVNREIPVSFGKFFVVKVDTKKSLDSEIQKLEKSPFIEYAEPNFVYRIIDAKENILETVVSKYRAISDDNAPVNDPMFSSLWGLHNTGSNDPSREVGIGGVQGADISAIEAWENYSKGDKSVKIAIIDTGVDYTHPDLVNNIWTNEAELNGKPGVDDDGNGFIDDIHGYDFANNDSDPRDGHSHGTHCAGTIAAEHNNNVGVAGVMAEASIVAVKFLTDSGSGSTENAIKSIDYATKLNVDLMSNSWGGGGFSQALKEAIDRANEKGIIFVAAAGNSNTNNDSSPHYPSNYQVENVVSVAAHNIADSLATFSCYGRNTVHIAAPGRNILSTVKNGGYAVYSGTSMATPHVSGVLGLLLANEGRMPMDVMKDRLLWTSVPVAAYKNKMVSGGRINAYNLLANFRPERNEPNPDAWIPLQLDEVLESSHPYANMQNTSKVLVARGAKFMRVVIEKFDFEPKYDYLQFKDKNGAVVDKIEGAGENKKTMYVEGDELTVEFISDNTVTKWGYLIKEIEIQME